MTVLETARDVAAEIGVVQPTSLVGNADITAARFLAAAKAEGISLARAHNWTILHREYEFTTTPDVDNYAVLDDWYKGIGNTAWDRTTFWRVRGNRSPAEWQFFKSALVTTPSLRFQYRLVVGPLAGSILLHPVPSVADDMVIEYVSSFWAQSAAAAGQAAILADDDEIRLDHELFRMGLLWRVKRSLGLPYIDDRSDYERALRDQIVADVNMPVICMAPSSVDLERLGVPDGNFPGPGNP